MDHAKSLMPPSTPSMMNMQPATGKGSRFCWYLHAYAYLSCALYVCIPFDDVSAMCRGFVGTIRPGAYCSRPYFFGWSQPSPHTPTDLHVCQTCRRPVHSALLHPSAARHMPAPTLTACLGHCVGSGPKGSFSLCLAGRNTVQCGGLHLSWVMQNSHCQPKKN